MISLDQVLLLQKKVETAVEKIAFLNGKIEQLKSENDALHTQCAELTKALEEKTELVSSLESNQGKIEEGILSALNRLDTVENSILSSSDGSEAQVSFDQQAVLEPVAGETENNSEQNAVQHVEQHSDESQNNDNQIELQSENNEQVQAEPVQQEPFRYEIVPDEQSEEESEQDSEPEKTADSLNGQFDIF